MQTTGGEDGLTEGIGVGEDEGESVGLVDGASVENCVELDCLLISNTKFPGTPVFVDVNRLLVFGAPDREAIFCKS